MNIIWPIIIVISYIYAIFAGTISEVNTSIFDVSKNVLNLSLTLVGNMCLWCGIINIIKSTKLVDNLYKILNPVLKFLYPDEKNDKKTMKEISINTISNIIGIGNAATSSGLKVMERLKEKNDNKNELTNSMIMLVILNTTSIQLIPTTVLSIRASLNSSNPSKIIIPIWISTFIGTMVGILLAKFMINLRRKHK